ncbi:hypothetical protein BCR36DRAFT_583129 [Piromyces finnis]|uniref:Uncharacterized protein n=1 Tax=Piromyces finnis TaxID=1754191 RepID=A0A1Y1VC81_9FUNG|nr:hypothetical protein BCR36DRAFT_583129 [Piromyces finnis]|eukprot:ORX51062.1 hypothetical protein BCR36DRAFT_583129 [Piromyces finnis]
MNLPNFREIYRESRTEEEEKRIKNNSFYKFISFIALSLVFVHVRNKNFNIQT